MHHSPPRATPILLALVFAGAASGSAQQRPHGPALPPVVARAFHQTYPAAAILGVSHERDNGRTVWEVESRDGSTRRDLLYSSSGEAIEIEETIPASELPPAVRAAVDSMAPGASVTRAERVTRGSHVSYELGIRARGRSRSLAFDPAGRPVTP